jgi:integrase
MDDITKQDILALVRPLARTPSAANHAFVVSRIFFRWALRNDYIQINPMAGLVIPHRTNSRARVLSDDELKSIWHVCARRLAFDDNACPGAVLEIPSKVPRNFATIVQLLILTGQRRGEIAALQPSWIKDNTIMIPASVAKNGREHIIPVGAGNAHVLASFVGVENSPPHSRLAFPARGTDSERSFNGWSKSKVALDKASGVTDWTLHDLRRTYASNMARLGVQLPVIEKLLNHVSGSFGGIVSVYQRHNFLPEMREAVDKYEKWLISLLSS